MSAINDVNESTRLLSGSHKVTGSNNLAKFDMDDDDDPFFDVGEVLRKPTDSRSRGALSH